MPWTDYGRGLSRRAPARSLVKASSAPRAMGLPAVTRDQILARIKTLEEQLANQQLDPRQSYSEGLAAATPILRELTSLQEQLRALDASP